MFFYCNRKYSNVVEIANDCVQPANGPKLDNLADLIVTEAQPEDHILVMSNGSFGEFIRN